MQERGALRSSWRDSKTPCIRTRAWAGTLAFAILLQLTHPSARDSSLLRTVGLAENPIMTTWRRAPSGRRSGTLCASLQSQTPRSGRAAWSISFSRLPSSSRTSARAGPNERGNSSRRVAEAPRLAPIAPRDRASPTALRTAFDSASKSKRGSACPQLPGADLRETLASRTNSTAIDRGSPPNAARAA